MAKPVVSYPSYEELHVPEANKYVMLSHEAERLFWKLDGLLEESISVMKHPYYSPNDPLEPYCISGSSDVLDNATPRWHSLSQSPYTEPKISSVVVTVSELDKWEDYWLEEHEDHGIVDEPDFPSEEPDCTCSWGPLPGAGADRGDALFPDWANGEPVFLLKCYGTERPPQVASTLLVRAAGGDDYITVHRCVSAVHPWLLSQRDKLLAAIPIMQARDDHETPLPPDTRLMLFSHDPSSVDVEEADDWQGMRKIPQAKPTMFAPPYVPENIIGGLPKDSIWRDISFSKKDSADGSQTKDGT